MGNLITVYRRECSSFFNSPIAYVMIVAFLVVMSLIFFAFLQFFATPNPDFRAYFEHLFPFCFFSFVFIPAITMRLWSEEKKQGTIEMLLTLPIKTWEVVLAKFLAAYTIVALAILLTLSVPLSIAMVMQQDWGAIFTNYVGILLISGVYIALGTWVSSMTENQMVAFIVAAVLSAIICFIGIPPVMKFADDNVYTGLGRLMGYLGTYFHYQNFAKGLLSPVDVIYTTALTGMFLIINNVTVEGRKYGFPTFLKALN